VTSLRLYLRSKLLAWLGYDFTKQDECPLPDAGLNEWLGTILPGAKAQFGLRRVPAVPPGVVRIVVEVCE
jgi:hypothetical protein